MWRPVDQSERLKSTRSSQAQGGAYRAALDPKWTYDVASAMPQSGHFSFSWMSCINVEISLTRFYRALTVLLENIIVINNQET